MKASFLADGFRKSFRGKEVLKAASVWAPEGKITALLGRNGSGKSTLIRCAMGTYWREQGTVHLDGEVHRWPMLSKLSAQGLFYLPDRGLLSRRMTVGQHMSLFQERFPGWRGEVVLEELGVSGFHSRRARELSGGEERRVELALAVGRRPRWLIADEPLAEVEPKDRTTVARLLRSLADDGAAVLVTGHEVRDLLDLADEVIWMAAGTTHGLGSPDDARSHDQFRREYLGPQVD